MALSRFTNRIGADSIPAIEAPKGAEHSQR